MDGRKRQPAEARSKFERWILENGGSGEIGKRLGVHQVTVSNWISKRAIPNTLIVFKILKLAKNELTLFDIIKGTSNESIKR